MNTYPYTRRRSGWVDTIGEMIFVFTLGLMIYVPLAMIGAIIAAVPIVLLWNWLIPDIFNGPTIGFWQAWGIALLSSLLFKSTSSSSKSD